MSDATGVLRACARCLARLGFGQIASGGLSRPSQLTWMLGPVGVEVGLSQIASGGLSRPSQLTWMLALD